MVKGRIYTDYLNIECRECNSIIDSLDFYGIDSVGVRLRAYCSNCERESIFKLKTYPMLGPVEVTDHYNKRGYKLFDGRRLNKHLRKIGHPNQLYKKRRIKKENIKDG